MTTNKTFLILLLAGISYTAYNATAVSENFEISTTIDHEIQLGTLKTSASDYDSDLNISRGIDIGTVIIDPAQSSGAARGDSNGYYYQGALSGGIIYIYNTQWGRFTANVQNYDKLTGLSLNYDSSHPLLIDSIKIKPRISYYSGNIYFVLADIEYSSTPHLGVHKGYITVTYTPES